MSWTFLYRSSDCFSSSIFRSCKAKYNGNWKTNEDRFWRWEWISWFNHQSIVMSRCTFSSLAAISDSTAFFIRCTSTSSEERKMSKTEQQCWWLASCSFVHIFYTFRLQVVTLQLKLSLSSLKLALTHYKTLQNKLRRGTQIDPTFTANIVTTLRMTASQFTEGLFHKAN